MPAFLVELIPDWTRSGGIDAIQAALDRRAAEGWTLRSVVGNLAYYDDSAPGGGGPFLSTSGGALTGPLAMTGSPISQLGDPGGDPTAAINVMYGNTHYAPIVLADAVAALRDQVAELQRQLGG